MYLLDNGRFKERLVFWDEDVKKTKTPEDIDVIYHMHSPEKISDRSFKFWDFIIEGSKTYDEVFATYKKSLRREINKYTRENNLVRLQVLKKPSPDDVSAFVSDFNEFARFKNFGTTSIELYNQILEEEKLTIFNLSVNGEVFNALSFYDDGKTVRQLHTFTINKQLPENKNSHKFLTDRSIEYYLNHGVEKYYFGGTYDEKHSKESRMGIFEFKKGFGGEEVQLWKDVSANNENGIKVIERYWR